MSPCYTRPISRFCPICSRRMGLPQLLNAPIIVNWRQSNNHKICVFCCSFFPLRSNKLLEVNFFCTIVSRGVSRVTTFPRCCCPRSRRRAAAFPRLQAKREFQSSGGGAALRCVWRRLPKMRKRCSRGSLGESHDILPVRSMHHVLCTRFSIPSDLVARDVSRLCGTHFASVRAPQAQRCVCLAMSAAVHKCIPKRIGVSESGGVLFSTPECILCGCRRRFCSP